MTHHNPRRRLVALAIKAPAAAVWGLVTRRFGPLDRALEEAETIHSRLDTAV